MDLVIGQLISQSIRQSLMAHSYSFIYFHAQYMCLIYTLFGILYLNIFYIYIYQLHWYDINDRIPGPDAIRLGNTIDGSDGSWRLPLAPFKVNKYM